MSEIKRHTSRKLVHVERDRERDRGRQGDREGQRYRERWRETGRERQSKRDTDREIETERMDGAQITEVERQTKRWVIASHMPMV